MAATMRWLSKKTFWTGTFFRFFSDFGGETALGAFRKIGENREKSKKSRSGDHLLFSAVPGKGFGTIFEMFGEGSEGILHRFLIDLECAFLKQNMPVEIQSRIRPTRND